MYLGYIIVFALVCFLLGRLYLSYCIRRLQERVEFSAFFEKAFEEFIHLYFESKTHGQFSSLLNGRAGDLYVFLLVHCIRLEHSVLNNLTMPIKASISSILKVHLGEMKDLMPRFKSGDICVEDINRFKANLTEYRQCVYNSKARCYGLLNNPLALITKGGLLILASPLFVMHRLKLVRPNVIAFILF